MKTKSIYAVKTFLFKYNISLTNIANKTLPLFKDFTKESSFCISYKIVKTSCFLKNVHQIDKYPSSPNIWSAITSNK